MQEATIEKLLIAFPEELIAPGLELHSQQEVFPVGRTDLIFIDSEERLLVVEVKKGTLTREHVGQIIEYWPQVKQRYADHDIRLMVVATDISYERRAYLEEFNIEFKEISLDILRNLQNTITGKTINTDVKPQEGSSPKGRKPKFNAAVYKSINTVARGLTTLSLKQREDLELPYYCLVWRDKRLESRSNRRFYKEKGSFWQLSAQRAYEMLDEAHARGLLSSRYLRWPDREIVAYDSATMDHQRKQNLMKETLTGGKEDRYWWECPNTRIVSCLEPWGEAVWRKAMILNPDEDVVTFRSITRADYYVHKYKERLHNGWQIDRSMMDADGAIHKFHLKALREIYGKQT